LEVQLREDMPGMDTLAKEALKRKKRKEEQRGQRQFAGAGSGLAAHEDEDVAFEEASDDGAGADNDFLSSKMSRRVMDEARAQLEEDAADPSFTGAASNMKKKKVRFGGGSSSSAAAASVSSSAAFGGSSIAAAVSNKPKRKSADSDESDDEDAEDDDDVVDFGEHDGSLRPRCLGRVDLGSATQQIARPLGRTNLSTAAPPRSRGRKCTCCDRVLCVACDVKRSLHNGGFGCFTTASPARTVYQQRTGLPFCDVPTDLPTVRALY